MRIVAQGTVAASDGGLRSSLCFPRITVLPGGRWLVAMRASPRKLDEDHQASIITWSDDQGATWHAPTSPFTAPAIDGRVGSFRTACPGVLPDGRIAATLAWQDVSVPNRPLFNPKTEGIVDMRVFLSFSADQGQTWSEPVRINERPHDQIPVALTGPILVMPDGRWACGFETNKAYDDSTPWRHAAMLTFSSDGGRTWGDAAVTAQDPARRRMFWDQRPRVLSDGSLLNLFWTFDNQTGEYDNIHAAISRDSGRTWSTPRDIGVPGQPAQPVELAGGCVAMVYIDRTAEPVIKLRTSNDAGSTFPVESELLVHRNSLPRQIVAKDAGDSVDAWAEMSRFSVGLPDAIALNDHELLAVWYCGRDSDHTDINWARITK